jgi:hypothetical protein
MEMPIIECREGDKIWIGQDICLVTECWLQGRVFLYSITPKAIGLSCDSGLVFSNAHGRDWTLHSFSLRPKRSFQVGDAVVTLQPRKSDSHGVVHLYDIAFDIDALETVQVERAAAERRERSASRSHG